MTTPTTKVNEWHTAKKGGADIRLWERGCCSDVSPGFPALPRRFEVYAMYGGELLPCTRGFDDEASARKYANELWRRY